MKLYTYWRSSAAYRVRIVLNLKHIDCELIPVNIAPDVRENHQPWYRQKNPGGLVPALELDNGTILRQSFAIIEYLESRHPTPPLLPDDALARAAVLALAFDIGMEIHPLNNLRVVSHLKKQHAFNQDMATQWMRHWIATGFNALEKTVAGNDYCYGDALTLADVFLMPQLYNALRWGMDLAATPRLNRIHTTLSALPAFIAAHPDNQPDAV